MNLHPAIGPNRYCGPGALAILTGLDTAQTAKRIREVSGSQRVRGTATRHMVQVLREEGYTIEQIQIPFRPTLAKFAELTMREGTGFTRGVYLVNVTNHYVVLDTREYFPQACDNQSVYPLCVSSFKRARKHVVTAWRVESSWLSEALQNI